MLEDLQCTESEWNLIVAVSRELKLELKEKRDMFYTSCPFDARDLDVLRRIDLFANGLKVDFIIPQVGRQVLPKYIAEDLGYRLHDKHYIFSGKGKYLIDGVKHMPLASHAAIIQANFGEKKKFFRVSYTVIETEGPICNGYVEKGISYFSANGTWPWKHISSFGPVRKQDIVLLIGGLEFLVPTSYFVAWGSKEGLVTRDGYLLRKHSGVCGAYMANIDKTEFDPIDIDRHWVATSSWLEKLNVCYTAEKFLMSLKAHIFAGSSSEYEETCYPSGEKDPTMALVTLGRFGRKIPYSEDQFSQSTFVKKFVGSWLSLEIIDYFISKGNPLNFSKLREWVYSSGGWIASSKYFIGRNETGGFMDPVKVNAPVQKTMMIGGGFGAEMKILEELKEYQNNPSREEAGDLAVSFASYVVGHDLTSGELDRAINGIRLYFPETMAKLEKRFLEDERYYSPPLPNCCVGDLPHSWDPGDGKKYIRIRGIRLKDFYLRFGRLAYIFKGDGDVVDGVPDIIIESGSPTYQYKWEGVVLVKGLPYVPVRGL